MIHLLISVKNAQEALDAMHAGADYIDLKDPAMGALGSLDDSASLEVIKAIGQQAIVSATVGDAHDNLHALLDMIHKKRNLGVDIIKLPIDSLKKEPLYFEALTDVAQRQKIQLIAVMFAEQSIDLSWIPILADIGFYGVMLDTSDKRYHLLTAASADALQRFIFICKKHHLKAGLAGALRNEYIEKLITHRPDYLGFRSGVCRNYMRQNNLLPHLVKEIKDKLYKHNNFCNKIES